MYASKIGVPACSLKKKVPFKVHSADDAYTETAFRRGRGDERLPFPNKLKNGCITNIKFGINRKRRCRGTK